MASSKQERSRRDDDFFDPSLAAAKELADNEGGGDLAIPEGAEFEEIDGPGVYDWDVVPFRMGKNAYMIHKDARPGQQHYGFTYLRHAGVGPDEQSVACLRNWGEKCPLCDDAADFRKQNDMRDEENKKTYNSMKAKYRTVMKVINAGDRKPRMKILAYSWHGFARQLAEKITGPTAERLGYKNFCRMKGGMTVSVKMSKTDMGKWVHASTIELLPRKDDLPADLLDQWGSVDEWLIKRTPDEIVRIRDGSAPPDEKDDDDDRPRRRRDDDDDDHRGNGRVSSSVSGPHLDSREEGRPIRRHVADRDDDDDRPARRTRDDDENPTARMGIEVGHFVKYKDMRCEVTKINRAGTEVDLRDDDSGEMFKMVDVTECEVDVEEAPKRKGRSRDDDDDDRPRRTSRDRDDDDDDGFKGRGRDDDDDDHKKEDEPVKRGRGRPPGSKNRAK